MKYKPTASEREFLPPVRRKFNSYSQDVNAGMTPGYGTTEHQKCAKEAGYLTDAAEKVIAEPHAHSVKAFAATRKACATSAAMTKSEQHIAAADHMRAADSHDRAQETAHENKDERAEYFHKSIKSAHERACNILM